MYKVGSIVEFEEWIPRKVEIKDNMSQTVEGTGVFASPVRGVFHGWGLDVDDGASYTVALVEKSDGTIATIHTNKIRFVQVT